MLERSHQACISSKRRTTATHTGTGTVSLVGGEHPARAHPLARTSPRMDPNSSLSVHTTAVRARCERTAVERCQVAFGEKADFGSVMPILSVGVRWGRVIDWVCKPEVTGSIPVRSISPC